MCIEPEKTIESGVVTWPDRIGIGASILCLMHCLLTPLLLSMSAVLVHFSPFEEKIHRAMALLITLIGTIALIRGFRTHRRVQVFFHMAAGLACIFFAAFAGDRLPAHWVEVAITCVGSVLIISAHRLNHTFCKDCACGEQQSSSSQTNAAQCCVSEQE